MKSHESELQELVKELSEKVDRLTEENSIKDHQALKRENIVKLQLERITDLSNKLDVTTKQNKHLWGLVQLQAESYV